MVWDLVSLIVIVWSISKTWQTISALRKQKVFENDLPAECKLDVTEAAQHVWRQIFFNPWPERWTVSLLLATHPTARILGETFPAKQHVVLWAHDSQGTLHPDLLSTLVHELVHVAFPRLQHGDEFSALVFWGCERIGATLSFNQQLPPADSWTRLLVGPPLDAKPTSFTFLRVSPS